MWNEWSLASQLYKVQCQLFYCWFNANLHRYHNQKTSDTVIPIFYFSILNEELVPDSQPSYITVLGNPCLIAFYVSVLVDLPDFQDFQITMFIISDYLNITCLDLFKK